MKLEQDDFLANQQITGYGDDWIEVNGVKHSSALLVTNDECTNLDTDFKSIDDINEDLIKQILASNPEIVLFGTGNQIQQVPLALVAQLANQGIGSETMDTLAATRTFNLLAGESRKVTALFLPRT